MSVQSWKCFVALPSQLPYMQIQKSEIILDCSSHAERNFKILLREVTPGVGIDTTTVINKISRLSGKNNWRGMEVGDFKYNAENNVLSYSVTMT